MKLNPLEWLREKQQQKRLTKVLNEMADRRELESRTKKLKEHVERIQAELWHRGFNVVKANSANAGATNARFYALTPNGRLTEVNVGIDGGFRIAEVMSK